MSETPSVILYNENMENIENIIIFVVNSTNSRILQNIIKDS